MIEDVLSISIPIVADRCIKDLAMHVDKLEKVLQGSDNTKMITIPNPK